MFVWTILANYLWVHEAFKGQTSLLVMVLLVLQLAHILAIDF